MIRQGLLGELHHIRAQWHRGNLPGNDSWQQPMPRAAKPDDLQAKRVGRKVAESIGRASGSKPKAGATRPSRPMVQKTVDRRQRRRRSPIDDVVDAEKFGYQDLTDQGRRGQGRLRRPAIEELIRWRLWDRTGAGLMAELGSHQLDAASIFIAAVHGGAEAASA